MDINYKKFHMQSLLKNFSKKISVLLLLMVVFIFFSGCAESIDVNTCLPDKIYGFWHGLWHGCISLITFIISLFDEDVSMYAVNNNGGWYNFGFLIGVIAIYGGGSKASSKKK